MVFIKTLVSREIFSDVIFIFLCLCVIFMDSVILILDIPIMKRHVAKPRGEVIGNIYFKVNDVRRRLDGDGVWDKVKSGTKIHYNDSIFTSAKSNAEIKFTDNTEIDVEEQSLVVIQKEEKIGDIVYQTIKIVRGQVNARILTRGKLKVGIKIKIHGVEAIIHDTNTLIQIKIGKDKKAKIQVLEGKADLIRKGKIVKLVKNQFSILSEKGEISAPKKVELHLLKPGRNKKLYINNVINLQFKWKDDKNEEVMFELADDINFENIIYEEIISNSKIEISKLEPNKYFWRISKFDPVTSEKIISEERKISVIRKVKPKLVVPLPGQTLAYSKDFLAIKKGNFLKWTATDDMKKFRIIVATAGGKNVLKEVLSENKFDISNLPPGNYKWVVEILDDRTNKFIIRSDKRVFKIIDQEKQQAIIAKDEADEKERLASLEKERVRIEIEIAEEEQNRRNLAALKNEKAQRAERQRIIAEEKRIIAEKKRIKAAERKKEIAKKNEIIRKKKETARLLRLKRKKAKLDRIDRIKAAQEKKRKAAELLRLKALEKKRRAQAYKNSLNKLHVETDEYVKGHKGDKKVAYNLHNRKKKWKTTLNFGTPPPSTKKTLPEKLSEPVQQTPYREVKSEPFKIVSFWKANKNALLKRIHLRKPEPKIINIQIFQNKVLNIKRISSYWFPVKKDKKSFNANMSALITGVILSFNQYHNFKYLKKTRARFYKLIPFGLFIDNPKRTIASKKKKDPFFLEGVFLSTSPQIWSKSIKSFELLMKKDKEDQLDLLHITE